MAERSGWLGALARRVTARTRALRWLLVASGVIVLPVIAAGMDDVITGGREIVGAGTIYDRYVEASGRFGTGPQYRVHIRSDSDGRTTTANSKELYVALDGRPSVPVEIEEDTFNHTISRVRLRGRWYLGAGYVDLAWLFLLVPLAAAALLVMGANWLALRRARRERRHRTAPAPR